MLLHQFAAGTFDWHTDPPVVQLVVHVSGITLAACTV